MILPTDSLVSFADEIDSYIDDYAVRDCSGNAQN